MEVTPDVIIDSVKSLIALGRVVSTIRMIEESKVVLENNEEIILINEEAERYAKNFNVNVLDLALLAYNLSAQSITDSIHENIDKARKDIIDTYKDRRSSEYDKKRQLDITTRDLCWHIREVRKRNGGVLSPELEDEWRKSLCDKFNFVAD